MFTGIITDIGRIESVEQRGDTRLKISCSYDMGSVQTGASIACSGICLTVTEKGKDWFAVDVSAETLACTADAMWQAGRQLNLERALRVGDELGGHIVTGHVDGVGTIVSAQAAGDSLRVVVDAPTALAAFLAAKGSVTLDGVSLTLNSVEDVERATRISVNIIPHTAAETTLGALAADDQVNLEIDILARYIGRMKQLST